MPKTYDLFELSIGSFSTFRVAERVRRWTESELETFTIAAPKAEEEAPVRGVRIGMPDVEEWLLVDD